MHTSPITRPQQKVTASFSNSFEIQFDKPPASPKEHLFTEENNPTRGQLDEEQKNNTLEKLHKHSVSSSEEVDLIGTVE